MRLMFHPKRVTVTAFALILLGGASKAAAEPVSRLSDDPPPSTFTLDRMDQASRLGIQVGFDKLDDIDLSDSFFMRYELYGQYVFPNTGGGVYVQAPFAHWFNFMSRDSNDHTSMGNIDIGGFLLPTHNSDLILRLGLALPTASDDANRVATDGTVAFERLTDLFLAAHDYTLLRLSASTVQEVGALFFRGDLGFDFTVDKPSNGQPSVLLRANVAGGARLDPVDLTVELVNLCAMNGEKVSGIENRFVHTAAAGFNTRGTDQFRLGMVFPLDEELRGEIWIFSLGYQHVTN